MGTSRPGSSPPVGEVEEVEEVCTLFIGMVRIPHRAFELATWF